MSKQKIYLKNIILRPQAVKLQSAMNNNINVVHIDGGESQYLALRQMNV